ncbi:MAG: amidohydrolase family protein [Candidatus Bathyarchaeota archaeon]|nr:amidohydrolase family protein [Candidatus Bathyarchaeota archaeon]
MLDEEITKIRVIDNHTHYPNVIDNESYISSVTNFLTDKKKIKHKVGGGALHPLRDSEYNEIKGIVKELYGYEHDAISNETKEELAAKIRKTWKSYETDDPYTSPLDLAGIEIALVNLDGLASNLNKNRFKWVPHVDRYLYPIKKANIQVRQMQYMEGTLEASYDRYGGKPESFDDYLKLVEDDLRNYKKQGVVAVKIWSAFFRSLHFQKVEQEKAKKVYSDYISNLPVDDSGYRVFQDCIAHHTFSLCKELDLPVHVHTGFGLANDRITVTGSSPCNLENIVKDSDYDGLKIVLIHGGYPHVREAGSLALMNDNVFIDSSWLSSVLPPNDLAMIFREWFAWKLEDKVLFGTDSTYAKYLTGDILCVYGARRARRALSLSLSGMMSDGVLGRDEAVEIAEKVLRQNALKLYEF